MEPQPLGQRNNNKKMMPSRRAKRAAEYAPITEDAMKSMIWSKHTKDHSEAKNHSPIVFELLEVTKKLALDYDAVEVSEYTRNR